MTVTTAMSTPLLNWTTRGKLYFQKMNNVFVLAVSVSSFYLDDYSWNLALISHIIVGKHKNYL